MSAAVAVDAALGPVVDPEVDPQAIQVTDAAQAADTTAPRRLALCADDFGLSLAIDLGIVDLAQRGRLTAIGCVTNGPHWAADARLLAALPDTVQLGLQFNLTVGTPLHPKLRAVWPSLPGRRKLALLAHLRQLPRVALWLEFQAQWQAFVQATGRKPRFVSGHQHIQHLPGVRRIVLRGVSYTTPPVAVRNTGRVAGPVPRFRRMSLQRGGGVALQRHLSRLRVMHNHTLMGLYDTARGTDFRALMQQWLAHVPAEGAMLCCHPSAPPEALQPGRHVAGESAAIDPELAELEALADPFDPLAKGEAQARVREYDYLGSDSFIADLAAADVVLGSTWVQRTR